MPKILSFLFYPWLDSWRLGLQEPEGFVSQAFFARYLETWKISLKIIYLKESSTWASSLCCQKKLVNFDWLSPETDHLDDERDSLSPYLPVNVVVTLDWVSSLLSAPSPLGWKDLVLASEDPASWLLRLPLQDYLSFGQPKPKMRNVIQRIQCRWNSETVWIWFNHSPGCLYSKIFPSSFSKLLVFPALQWINCRYKNASQQQFDQVNSSRTLNCLKLHRRIVAGVTFSTSFFQGFGLQPNHQASTDPRTQTITNNQAPSLVSDPNTT